MEEIISTVDFEAHRNEAIAAIDEGATSRRERLHQAENLRKAAQLLRNYRQLLELVDATQFVVGRFGREETP